MKDNIFTNQGERRLFLLTELIGELPRNRQPNIPDDSDDQKRLLRSLMNIRPAAPVSETFLKVQYAYLQE
jgi:hypothetical protein